MTPAAKRRQHGDPSKYRRDGCRCDKCRAAVAAQARVSRERRRLQQPLTDSERHALPLDGEEWRTLEDAPDYEVSNLGRVRSLKYTRPRLLSQMPNRDGYLRVSIWNGNKNRLRFVARLVAAAFLGPCPDGQEVRHYNDDKSDNTVANLLYGTRSQNILDAVRNGTQAQAAKTHCPQGHPYDAANTYVRPQGWRSCRACQAARRSVA